mgnify:CR=1 FL=1
MLSRRHLLQSALVVTAAVAASLSWNAPSASAQQNGDKPFHALVTDAKDMQPTRRMWCSIGKIRSARRPSYPMS